jgi:hypothetical protein
MSKVVVEALLRLILLYEHEIMVVQLGYLYYKVFLVLRDLIMLLSLPQSLLCWGTATGVAIVLI